MGWPTLKIVFEQKEHFTVISTQCSLFSWAAGLGVFVGSDSSARSPVLLTVLCGWACCVLGRFPFLILEHSREILDYLMYRCFRGQENI